VIPEPLIEAFIAVRTSSGRHCQLVDQAVLSTFIEDGHFHRHIREMRTLYAARQKVFVTLIQTLLGDQLDVEPVPAGMHIAVRLKKKVDPEALAEKASREGIILVPFTICI